MIWSIANSSVSFSIQCSGHRQWEITMEMLRNTLASPPMAYPFQRPPHQASSMQLTRVHFFSEQDSNPMIHDSNSRPCHWLIYMCELTHARCQTTARCIHGVSCRSRILLTVLIRSNRIASAPHLTRLIDCCCCRSIYPCCVDPYFITAVTWLRIIHTRVTTLVFFPLRTVCQLPLHHPLPLVAMPSSI